MATKINNMATGAVRIMLRNKEDIHVELRGHEDNHYLFDISYENVFGVLTFRTNAQGGIEQASLNLNKGRIITLQNDANLSKLCLYVLEQQEGKAGDKED